MPDSEKVIKGLEELSGFLFKEYGKAHAEEASLYYNRFLAVDDALAILKEQEIGHWVFLTDCSNSGVYCSECNTKVFDSYPFKKKLAYFCPHCGTRMEGEIERR